MYTIYRNGQIYGPYTPEQLRHYMSQGMITTNDLASVDGDPRWIPLQQLINRPASHATASEVRPNSPPDFAQALQQATPTVIVTPLIIAANIIVFGLMVASGVSLMDPDTKSLVAWGADYGPLTTNGEWWRAFTSTFVHIGVLHILMNMWVLYDIGKFTERLFGNFGFIVLYLLAGLGGSLASLAWHPNLVSAGASGAIFGLYGALFGFLAFHRHTIPPATLKSLTNSTVSFVLYNLVFGVIRSGTDMAAHMGGLVTGFLAALVLAEPPVRATAGSRAVRGVIALLLGAIAAVACAAQFQNSNRAMTSERGPAGGEQGADSRSKVVVGTKDVVYFSGSATREDAETLGRSLQKQGYFLDKGFVVSLSKDAREGVAASFVVKDGAWDRPKSVLAFEEMGRKVAPLIGGFPIKVRLLDTSRGVRLESIVGKLRFNANDDVYYLGSATEADAAALGRALEAHEFFGRDGVDVFLAKHSAGTMLSLIFSEKGLEDSSAIESVQVLVREIADTIGGPPIQLRLLDSELTVRKELTVD